MLHRRQEGVVHPLGVPDAPPCASVTSAGPCRAPGCSEPSGAAWGRRLPECVHRADSLTHVTLMWPSRCSLRWFARSLSKRLLGPAVSQALCWPQTDGREDADTSEHTQGQRLAVRTLPLAGAQPVGRAQKKAVRTL